MTMLSRVQHRQVDGNRTLDASCPASSNRSSEFYKALMVEVQRLQFEYDGLPLDRMWPQWALLTPVFFFAGM